MPNEPFQPTLCLEHQLPEDRKSPVGLVCPQCKQRLEVQPPAGRCMSFWESQPVAYTPEGEPCFVFTLLWEDFRIRSLHGPDSHSDRRAEIVRRREEQRRAEEEQQRLLETQTFESWNVAGYDFEIPYFDDLNFDEADDWDAEEL